jgi:catechol 2,3-dioxygenase-like lactoylglutathione lyase family enzyme
VTTRKNVCIVAVAIMAIAGALFPQHKVLAQVVSLSHAIHAVEDLDTTLAFYREVFGIDGNAQDFANPAVPLLTNAPGVTLRLSMVVLPGGTRFEFTHFKGVERHTGRAAYTDPGAGSLVFYVRDLDTLVAAARKASGTVVTTGGAPVEIMTGAGMARSIMLRDPDGFFVQLIEASPADAAPEGNIHRVALAYTMEDAAATRAFYTDTLGIELAGSTNFHKDAALARLVGAPEAVEFRKLEGTLPPGADVQFTEFRGTPRTKFHLRVRDPGAPALAIQVTDIERLVAQMRSAGVNIISANGELVDFGNGIHNIFVEDPNGMNLELFERGSSR